MHSASRQETAIELARLGHARQVLTALQVAAIDVLVLKGTALAYWLYRQPAWRPRCDLDLLVMDRATAQCAVDALASLGYLPVAEVSTTEVAEFEVALERHTPTGQVYTVDLHWQLVNHASLTRGFGFDELWTQRIRVDALHPQAFGLCRMHALTHALLHRVTNMPQGQQDRLIWLYDIHLLASGASADEWQSFLRLCGEKRIATPCLDGLVATRAVFATTIPAAVEADLRQRSGGESWQLGGTVDQGVMDRAHLGALGWPDKLRWLRRKLFPPAEFMRYRYQAVGPISLCKAYLTRWWVGIRRALGWR
jgi:hypothetical protein